MDAAKMKNSSYLISIISYSFYRVTENEKIGEVFLKRMWYKYIRWGCAGIQHEKKTDIYYRNYCMCRCGRDSGLVSDA